MLGREAPCTLLTGYDYSLRLAGQLPETRSPERSSQNRRLKPPSRRPDAGHVFAPIKSRKRESRSRSLSHRFPAGHYARAVFRSTGGYSFYIKTWLRASSGWQGAAPAPADAAEECCRFRAAHARRPEGGLQVRTRLAKRPGLYWMFSHKPGGGGAGSQGTRDLLPD